MARSWHSVRLGACAVAVGFVIATSAGHAQDMRPQLAADISEFKKLNGPDIQRLFEDLHLANYPDDGSGSSDVNWAMTFNASGSFDANAFGTGDNGHGDWRVEQDKQCVEVGSVYYTNFGEGAEPLSGCFDVYVQMESGTIAFASARNPKELIVLEDGAYGELARLDLSPKTAPVRAPETMIAKTQENKVEQPVPPVVVKPKPEVKKPAPDNQKLALERQRLTEEAKLNKMRLQLERDRMQQELAIKRQRLDLERQALILKQRQRGLTASQDLAPPVIRTVPEVQTKDAIVTLQGLVNDDNPIIRVEVNGEAVKFGREDGRFAAEVPVNLGVNNVRVAAFDVDGNRAEQIVSVTRSRDIPNIEFGNYRALVIGINEYEALPHLKTAVRDARAVAETLETKYGFSVNLLLNPSRDEIVDAFDELRDTATEDDNVVIYYAGHGWLDAQSGRGYWLPVDARKDRRSRWLANSNLTDMLQATFAKHVLVVADSCYSGTLTRSLKIPERNSNFIAHMAQKRARVVLSSGGLEPVADSGGGQHSVFAAQFLRVLEENEGVVDGTKMFEKIRQSVVLNADQTPEYSDIRLAGHEGGDFLFVRKD